MGYRNTMTFSFGQTKIRLGFLFSAVTALLFCFDTDEEIKLGLIFSIMHEFGHLAAILYCGEKPAKLCFGLFGMTIIRTADTTQNYRNEALTAFAGPMTNLIAALLFLLIYSFAKSEVLLKCGLINLIIGGFNLCPVFGLDGGRAFESILKSHTDAAKSDRIIKATSFVTLAVMMSFGFFILIKSGYNFTLLAISVYLTAMLLIKC